VIKFRYLAPVAAVFIAGMTSCKTDFLTGGDLSVDPNRPTTATATQLFQGIQTNLWAFFGSDPARVTGMWARQFAGGQNQYESIYHYQYDEGIQSGFTSGLYTAGGLIDIARAQKITSDAKNYALLGILQVQEGMMMGTGADLFGDLVYSQALKGTPNPTLDPQLSVYDSVQKVLSAGIANMANTAATSASPVNSDLDYGGDLSAWTALAHTMKARFFMHTAEVRPLAYASALAEAQLGITADAGNYVGAFSANSGEQNFYYQFDGPAGRKGYLIADTLFINLLRSRGDARVTDYFEAKAAPQFLSPAREDPAFQQPYVTYDENTLIWAEAAYRTGNQVLALQKLNEERANHALAAEAVAGQALLNEILTEKYIADFQLGHEAWNDYKRTCTPNFPPTVAGKTMPGRMYYDTHERLTNTNIPPAGQGFNAARNANDPPNATSDGTGAACLSGS